LSRYKFLQRFHKGCRAIERERENEGVRSLGLRYSATCLHEALVSFHY
jgi:hypothetical protein